MEVGAAVWVKDKEGEEAWVPGTVLEKSGGKPCKVQIEVDEEFSEEPLTFTFSEDDGEYIFLSSLFCFCSYFNYFVFFSYFSDAANQQKLSRASKQRRRTTLSFPPPLPPDHSFPTHACDTAVRYKFC